MHVRIESEREDDGRWIGEALDLPGGMSYGLTRAEALGSAEKIAISFSILDQQRESRC